MLSMMSWSVDGRVEETEQDSPAVMSSTYFHLLGAEEATWLTIARKTTGPTLVPWELHRMWVSRLRELF